MHVTPDRTDVTASPVAGASGRLRRLLLMTRWSVLDQAISSGSNFLTAFVLVTRFSAPEYGAYSLGAVVFVLSLNLARVLCGDPLVIRHAQVAEIRSEVGRAAGSALVVGSLLSLLLAAGAVLAEEPLAEVLGVLALALPLLLVQDAGRLACFALGRARTAAGNDAAWAAVQVTCLVGLTALDVRSLAVFVAAWLVPGAAAGLLVLRQLGVRPTPRAAPSWLREHWRLSLPLAGAFLLGFGPSYVVFALAPVVADLAELGLARAAYLPFAVLAVFVQGIGLFLFPALVGRSPDEAGRLAVRASGSLTVLALLWSSAVLLVLPDGVGRLLLGPAWSATEGVRWVFAASVVLQAAGVPLLIALRSAGAAQRLLTVHLATAPLVLGIGVGLTAELGALGLALGVLVGDALTLPLAWWHVHALRRTSRPPVAAAGAAATWR